MVTEQTRVIRVSGRARAVTALIAAGVALAAVPAASALASSNPGNPDRSASTAVTSGVTAASGPADTVTADKAKPKPKPRPKPKPKPKPVVPPEATGWDPLKHLFSPNECSERGHAPKWGTVLHGDLVVMVAGNPTPRVAQQGVVSAVGSLTFTVTSADGYSLIWSLASDGHVFYPSRPDQLSSLTVGLVVTVVGTPITSTSTTSTSSDTSTTATSPSDTTTTVPETPAAAGALLVTVMTCHDLAPVPTSPSPTTSTSSSTTSTTSSSSSS
jgi:hypothetical protein